MLRKFSEILFGKKATQSMAGLLPQITPAQRRYEVEKEYIARESLVGARILGQVPSGHQREFFCLDRHTWVWHESWTDENGKHQSFTVNYEIDPSGILKRINGGQYTLLQGEELQRFVKATQAYRQEVTRHVYGQPATA